MTKRRRKAAPERALAARAPPHRDIMKVHRLLAHPSETITRATTKATGIIITGEWRPCMECDQSKAHRHVVPRTTDHRALERMPLLYVDLAGPVESENTDESRYVMMIADDFSSFKVSKFLKTKSSVKTATVLARYVAIYITLEQVSIRAVYTNYGGEFEWEFQQKLYQLGIRHQHTPPDMPKCNGVAKQWIGLLRQKTVALLGDLENLAAGLRNERYCAEAWNYSTDVTNMCATTSIANGIALYQMHDTAGRRR